MIDTDEALARLRGLLETHDQLQQLTARASSPNGHVTVEVNPAGGLVDLRIGQPAMALTAEQLTREILAASRLATDNVQGRVVELVGGLVPETTMSALLAGRLPTSVRERAKAELDDAAGVAT